MVVSVVKEVFVLCVFVVESVLLGVLVVIRGCIQGRMLYCFEVIVDILDMMVIVLMIGFFFEIWWYEVTVF